MEPVFSQRLDDGRLLCSLCPRRCRLTNSESGWCGALERHGDELVSPEPGAPFRLDVAPAEASGLQRFCPGTAFAAIRTRGSGLEVWGRPRDPREEHLPWLSAEEAVVLARTWGCRGVFLAQDDPVYGITEGFALFERARAAGLKTAIRSSGYLLPRGREILFAFADAVEFRLYSIAGALYGKRFSARVEPILETIAWAAQRPDLWIEITVPLLPGENDDPAELRRLGDWLFRGIGAERPVHVTSGGPALRESDLDRAAAALRAAGLRDVEPLVPSIPEPLALRPQ